MKQEFIPAGCVLPAAVAVMGGSPHLPPEQAPPWPDLPQLPPWLWAWRNPPPTARSPLMSPLVWASKLARHAGIPSPWRLAARHAGIPSPWTLAARHAGIPPAMYAGIAPPPPCEQNDRQVKKYYLVPNFVCGRQLNKLDRGRASHVSPL